MNQKTIQPLGDDDDDYHGSDADADSVRNRIQEMYEQQGSTIKSKSHDSLIARFWDKHSHHSDQQAAWESFYAGLEDHEKQQVWEEYHAVQKNSQTHTTSTDELVNPITTANQKVEPKKPVSRPHSVRDNEPQNIAAMKERLLGKVKQNAKSSQKNKQRLKPLTAALLVGGIVLFMNYNELVVAQVRQYVSPGNSLRSPIIIDPNAEINIGDESRIIIPKINVDVPVVYDVTTYDERDIQNALERGVVHYGTTPTPGQPGNNVIVGHSSNNFFNSGKYKFAFVLLDRLETNDTFILHHKGVRYVYKVTLKKVIEPDDFSLIQPTVVPTTTLITCTPPGTSWKRLVVQAEQISPSPTTEPVTVTQVAPESADAQVVPGNAPSFFQRVRDWLF